LKIKVNSSFSVLGTEQDQLKDQKMSFNILSSLIIWDDQIKEKLSHPKGKTNKTSNPTSGQQKYRSTHLNVHEKKPMTSSRSEKKIRLSNFVTCVSQRG
jgi:predicted metalloenzyme YecM